MLIANQVIETRWHPRNKAHLEAKGYNYTGVGTPVFVSLEDMLTGSKCKVKVLCDYCGKQISKTYKDYFAQKHYGKDCCKECASKVRSITNQERYGGNAPASSPLIKAKIQATNIEKYGVPTSIISLGVKEKAKKTNLERYGFENPASSPQIKEKIRNTLCQNGNTPTSKQQIKIYEMLCDIYGAENVCINKPFGVLSLDCQLQIKNYFIDVEYDGWFWHKSRQERDRRRNWYLIRRGFKILRIRSNYDMPTKEQIINAIDYLTSGNHSLTYIDLDI